MEIYFHDIICFVSCAVHLINWYFLIDYCSRMVWDCLVFIINSIFAGCIISIGVLQEFIAVYVPYGKCVYVVYYKIGAAWQYCLFIFRRYSELGVSNYDFLPGGAVISISFDIAVVYVVVGLYKVLIVFITVSSTACLFNWTVQPLEKCFIVNCWIRWCLYDFFNAFFHILIESIVVIAVFYSINSVFVAGLKIVYPFIIQNQYWNRMISNHLVFNILDFASRCGFTILVA